MSDDAKDQRAADTALIARLRDEVEAQRTRDCGLCGRCPSCAVLADADARLAKETR